MPFAYKVATQDWHPTDHISFNTNHPPPNNKPFEDYIDMPNPLPNATEKTKKQRLWPVHCVQGTKGAEMIPEIDTAKIDLIVHKGMDRRVEMYSGFDDAFGNECVSTGGVSASIVDIFKKKGITDVYVTGVAGDFCVKYTALSAKKAGFNAYVVEECQKCVGSWSEAVQELGQAKVGIVKLSGSEIAKVKALKA